MKKALDGNTDGNTVTYNMAFQHINNYEQEILIWEKKSLLSYNHILDIKAVITVE